MVAFLLLQFKWKKYYKIVDISNSSFNSIIYKKYIQYK